MTLGDRILDRLNRHDMSQAELARRVGVSQPTINALIRGDNQGSKHLHKIATVLGTTPAYLEGKTEDPAENALTLPSPDVFAEQFNLALVPQLELGYSMGGGSIFDSYEHTGIVPFQRDWLRSMMKGSFEDLFVARGEGDSMQPTLLDGDIVLIDTSQKDIRQQDRVWAIAYGDLGMIKRVRRLPGGSYSVMSDNPAVQAFHAVDDEMYVIGRVIWIGRRI
jgi:phage repressor protein C with HTH and peptisase S24 domain